MSSFFDRRRNLSKRDIVSDVSFVLIGGNRKRTALRASSLSGFVFLSSLRLVFPLSSDEPRSRDPVAVEPSTSPSKGQDPEVDPETLEAETAPASNAATRAARPPTTCSIFVTLVVIVAIDWESVGAIFFDYGHAVQKKKWQACELQAHLIDFIFPCTGAATRSLKVRSRSVRTTKI